LRRDSRVLLRLRGPERDFVQSPGALDCLKRNIEMNFEAEGQGLLQISPYCCRSITGVIDGRFFSWGCLNRTGPVLPKIPRLVVSSRAIPRQPANTSRFLRGIDQSRGPKRLRIDTVTSVQSPVEAGRNTIIFLRSGMPEDASRRPGDVRAARFRPTCQTAPAGANSRRQRRSCGEMNPAKKSSH
jgi:hypothetical protein